MFVGIVVVISNLGGYVEDFVDIINYVLKYDNEILWDQFNYILF